MAETQGDIELDVSKVFGATDTHDFSELSKTFGVDFAPKGDPGFDPAWFMRFRVEGARDVKSLPVEYPPIGTIILIFNDAGRIDRFEVAGNDRLNSHCRPGVDPSLIDHSYGISREHIQVGRYGEMLDDDACNLSWSQGMVVRIMIIEPK